MYIIYQSLPTIIHEKKPKLQDSWSLNMVQVLFFSKLNITRVFKKYNLHK